MECRENAASPVSLKQHVGTRLAATAQFADLLLANERHLPGPDSANCTPKLEIHPTLGLFRDLGETLDLVIGGWTHDAPATRMIDRYNLFFDRVAVITSVRRGAVISIPPPFPDAIG